MYLDAIPWTYTLDRYRLPCCEQIIYNLCSKRGTFPVGLPVFIGIPFCLCYLLDDLGVIDHFSPFLDKQYLGFIFCVLLILN